MTKKVDKKTGKKRSAAPGTQDDKAEKVKREEYAVPEKLFDAWPADWDGKKHKPLKRKDFKDETIWLLRKADEADAKAVSFRKQAEDWKKLGNVKDRAKAKRFLNMASKIKDLEEQLRKEGVDVDALKAQDGDES